MRFFIASLILFFVNLAFAAPSMNDCRKFFLYPDGTDNLISYLEQLSSSGQLPYESYMQFFVGLIRGDLISPISRQQAKISGALAVHRSGIEVVLSNYSFDLEKLKDWASNQLKLRAIHTRERQEIKTETAAAKLKIKPGVIDLQAFKPDHGLSQYPLQIMNMPITQRMWQEVMGANPSHFNGITPRAGRKQTFLPDNPVENMTYWSAIVFANKFSEKHGHPPVYDLTGVNFPNAKTPEEIFKRAANGALEVDKDSIDKFLQQNNIDQIVNRPGFRLPTTQEFNIVVFQVARYEGRSVDEISLQEYKNLLPQGTDGGTRTSPIVSGLEYLEVAGQPVTDLLGNVRFWQSNLHYPQRAGAFQSERAAEIGIGGSAYSDRRRGRAGFRAGPNMREPTTGIFLIRSVVP